MIAWQVAVGSMIHETQLKGVNIVGPKWWIYTPVISKVDWHSLPRIGLYKKPTLNLPFGAWLAVYFDHWKTMGKLLFHSAWWFIFGG